MKLEISRVRLGEIQAAAAASPAVEVCGLLLGERFRVEDVVSCRNVADHPATSFEIDPQALIAAYKAARAGGPAVIGHYHSHPNGRAEPSAHDAANAMGDGAVWIIVGAHDVSAWRSTSPGKLTAIELYRFPGLRRGSVY